MDTSVINNFNGSQELSIPIGSLLMWMGENIPSGFMECDGSVLSISEYPELFEVFGKDKTPWGGNFQLNSSQFTGVFNLPDLRESATAGVGKRNDDIEHDEYKLGELKVDQLQGHEHEDDKTRFRKAHREWNAWTYRNSTWDEGGRMIVPHKGNLPRTDFVTRQKRYGLRFIIRVK